MKKLVLILLICNIFLQKGFTQITTMYPIGDNYIFNWDINAGNLKIYYPGNLHLGSAQGNMLGTGNFTVEGSANVDITAKEINFKNTHIGSSDPNFKVHASTKSFKLACSINSSGITPEVPIYEKIEYGIELPDEIQEKINLFLSSNSSAANPNHPGLNPYDPQDISIEASITHTINDTRYNINTAPPFFTPQLASTITVYGFYYQEASPTADLTGWTVNNQTAYPFRVRFAPPYMGDYVITFKIVYWDNGSYHTIDLDGVSVFPDQPAGTFGFNFKGVANTSGKAIAKGYLEVGKHKRQLRHSYDKTSFFPIGMNLPELPAPPGFNWTNNPLRYTPYGYQVRRDIYLSNLANNHGNFVRIISFAEINAIETSAGGYENTWGIPNATSFGQLGNYHKNQKHMWETDQDLERCENLGVFLNFCLQIHYPLEKIDGREENWQHNAYKIELGLAEVKDFFSNPNANKFFRNKLRYAQARWGYSAAIGMWQLASEISQAGIIAGGKGPYLHDYQYYDQDHVQKLYDWQCAMTDYIKSVYPNHLTNTCYALNPFGNYSGSLGNNPACVDKSFTCSNMDIISWNYYNFDALEDINRSRFEAVSDVIYNTDNVDCGMGPVGYFIDKPLLFTEVGTNKDYYITDNSPSTQEIAQSDYIDTLDRNIDKCTDIEVHNQIWAGAMSGELGTPLEWHNNTDINALNSYFSNFNALSSFFDDIDFEAHKYRPSVSSKEELIDKGGSISVNENMDLEIFVMQNDNSGIGDLSDRGFGWVHHKNATYFNETSGFINNTCTAANPDPDQTIDLISNRTYDYKLNGFKPGNYFIEIYNTRTGSLIFSSDDNDDIHASLLNVLKLGIPHNSLYRNSTSDQVLDYAFKFYHSNLNVNDLRLSQNADSSRVFAEIHLPGNDTNYKKYFLVNFYPNPSNDIIQISSLGEEIKSTSITDLTGNIILNENSLNKYKTELSISTLATGIYFLNVKSTSGIVKIFKLVKE